jgi:transposase-like protein
MSRARRSRQACCRSACVFGIPAGRLSANVLRALPRPAHPGAKKALAEIWNAENKDHARTAVRAFAAAYGAKFPKAAAKITEDEEELLAFYDYPAEHWVHLRTTNPIESTFATVRLRTKVTKGYGSKAAPWRWPSS